MNTARSKIGGLKEFGKKGAITVLQKEGPPAICNVEFNLFDGPVLVVPVFGLRGNEISREHWRERLFIAIEVYSLIEAHVVVLLQFRQGVAQLLQYVGRINRGLTVPKNGDQLPDGRKISIHIIENPAGGAGRNKGHE